MESANRIRLSPFYCSLKAAEKGLDRIKYAGVSLRHITELSKVVGIGPIFVIEKI